MQSPNILITNYCNQNCDFCFAKREMNKHRLNREMKISDFKQILLKMKRVKKGIDTVKLLGGEPTLHSQFDEIVELSLKYFPHLQIFTNGIFSEEKVGLLIKYSPRIKLTLNIMTPSFLSNERVRAVILDNITRLSAKTNVTLSITMNPHTNWAMLLSNIPREVIKSVNIRIGIANPILDDKNFYSFTDFPKIGNKLYSLVKYIRRYGSKKRISLNCGFTRCMIGDKQYEYLKNEAIFSGWGCFGKDSIADISTNLYVFHCFSLSEKYRQPSSKYSLIKLNAILLLKRYEYWKKIVLTGCKTCPYFGHDANSCPGPCIAFAANYKNSTNS